MRISNGRDPVALVGIGITILVNLAGLAWIALESCAGCGGQVRVIACIEDAGVIGKILAHLERQHPSVTTVPPLPARGPPRQGALELG